MGGAAAEQRRQSRRHREQANYLNPAENLSLVKANVNTRSFQKPARLTARHATRRTTSVPVGRLSLPPRQHVNVETKTVSSTQGSSKEKKKLKKPKHLKRKLEALSEDCGERKRLLSELQSWEASKGKTKNVEKQKIDAQSNVSREDQQVTEASLAIKKPHLLVSRQRHPTSDVVPTEESSSKRECGSLKVGGKARDDCAEIRIERMMDTKELSGNPKLLNGDDDDDEHDDDVNSGNGVGVSKRQRGKRRRGRKDTPKEESDSGSTRDREVSAGAQAGSSAISARQQSSTMAERETVSKDQGGDQRYCIGRKPVTDFVIGQTYRGKVVYVKPYGVFLDIGCHSDAFCHVSRLRDDYVSSPQDLFKAGDEIDAVRVIEIDRQQKRITVSLQSMARLADEQVSIEARRERSERRKPLPKQQLEPQPPLAKADCTQEISANSLPGQGQAHPLLTVGMPSGKAEGDMSRAEVKRERKIARRAARRAEKSHASASETVTAP